MTFLHNALQYAQRGLSVFALKPRDKKPLERSHGFKDATTNDRAIQAWWALNPDRNIGIATGAVSGIVVIDVDGDAGKAEWAALKGANDDTTLTSKTGSDGRHLLFAHPGFEVNNSPISKNIHVRADGGYIVAPPSIHPGTGAAYQWVDPDAPIAPLPAWLIAILEARGSKPALSGERLPAVASARPTIKYAEVALDGEITAVKSAGEGNRNIQLNTSAFNLGTLVGNGTLDRYTVEDALLNAALSAGLDEPEARKTIASGVKAGINRPRDIKPREAAPQPDLRMDPLGDDAANFADQLAEETFTREAKRAEQADVLPAIQTNGRELRDITADSIAALNRRNRTFVRSGELVRIRIDEKRSASIETMSESITRGALARSANYFTMKYSEKNGWVETTVAPPLDVVRDVMALGEWPFQPLDGVIEAPTIRPDGSILREVGYDATTRLFLASAEIDLPEVPESPTREDVDASLAILQDLFIDFPFEDEASHDNALGSLLTAIARPMISGPVPMALYDSPQQGTGKTMIAQMVGLAATGEMPEPAPAPDAAEEWRKSISAQLGAGRSVILIDNITRTLEDGALAAALTSTTWSDRLMGRNDKLIRLPARACWMATGNNIRVGGDLISRSYLIRLDAKTSRPQEREGFKHPNIERWVRSNRGMLLGAALIMCRAWHVAGRPAPTCPRMRYGEWRSVIGGVLEYAGVKHFLGNLRTFQEASDTEGPAWERFITKLIELFGTTATPSQIYARFASSDDLATALPGELEGVLGAPDDQKAKNKFCQKLGYLFRDRINKRYGDSQARISGNAKDANGVHWQFASN